MTKEEMELLKPIVREIMSRSDRNVTDDDLRRALEQLSAIGEPSNYSYQHPDYGQMVGDVHDALQPLLDTGDNLSPRMRQPRLWIR